MMLKQILPAARMLMVLTVLTGLLYPLAMTLIAQVVFPEQANGSLLTVDGVMVGSVLIGQATNNPRYFWSRPSAVAYMQGSSPDALGASGATNYSGTSTVLAAEIAAREAAFREEHNLSTDVDVPVEMLFASGSGLDPHISPESARLQINRVAIARGLDRDTVANLVETHIEGPQLGFLGQPRVNVLLLNLALDAVRTGIQ
jgi:K+-transporting ATPase ATPase C chain